MRALPAAGLALIAALAFTHLTALPAFEDEGSQLRWVDRIVAAGEWLRPLGEGKPLEAWPMVPLVRLGLAPLIAARALHVLAGMLAAVLTYVLAAELTGRWTALAAGALFALCPFAVYLERLALSDMFLCAAGLAVLLALLRLVRSATWPRAAGLGAALAVAALAKLPVGFVFLIAAPLALALMPVRERARLVQAPVRAKLLAAYAPALLLALGIGLAAAYRARGGRSLGFGLDDLIGIGLGGYRGIPAAFGVSGVSLWTELTAQLSAAVVVIGLIGLGAGAAFGAWRVRWLLAMGLVPMLALSRAEFWFSRYLLFTLPSLIIVAVLGWGYLYERAERLVPPFRAAARVLALALLASCAAVMALQSARIILDPIEAHWSPVDRFQYIEGWTSGYGYPEAARFVVHAPDAPATIWSLDGHSAYQLRCYLPAAWQARARPVFYGNDGALLRSAGERLQNLAASAPAWVIAPDELLQDDLASQLGGGTDLLTFERIASFQKPGARTHLSLYSVARR